MQFHSGIHKMHRRTFTFTHTHTNHFLKWILLGESEHKLIGLYHLIESDEKGKIFISIRTEHFCCGCGGLKTENTYTETVQRWKFLFHRIHIQLFRFSFLFCSSLFRRVFNAFLSLCFIEVWRSLLIYICVARYFHFSFNFTIFCFRFFTCRIACAHTVI